MKMNFLNNRLKKSFLIFLNAQLIQEYEIIKKKKNTKSQILNNNL